MRDIERGSENVASISAGALLGYPGGLLFWGSGRIWGGGLRGLHFCVWRHSWGAWWGDRLPGTYVSSGEEHLSSWGPRGTHGRGLSTGNFE
jgi:hypothetical protein